MKKATAMLGSLALGLGLLLTQGTAQAEPVKIRVGIGSAVEEQIWLLIARPDLGTHYGKAYTIEWNRFPGADKRIQAFEAGAQDVITASANGAILAASEGIDFKMVASLSRESSQGFFTKFDLTKLGWGWILVILLVLVLAWHVSLPVFMVTAFAPLVLLLFSIRSAHPMKIGRAHV